MTALARHVLPRTLLFLAALLALLLLPRWSLAYWQAWLYWAIFAGSVLAITLYFLKYDPALIARRAKAGAAAETERVQKRIQTILSFCFFLLFALPGLDRRFDWSRVPPAWALAADAVALAGWALMFASFKANSFAASTVTVEPDQPVVSTGLYGIVRHPMYLGAALLLGATPVALGSLWALIPAAGAIAGLIWRLLEEERFLVAALAGYAEYRRRIRCRLVPFLW